jgi:protein TonB
LFQPRPVPAIAFAERFRSGAGRRAIGVGLTLLVEALMLLVMLSLVPGKPPGAEDARSTLVTFDVAEASEEPTEARTPEPARRAEQRPEPEEPRPPPPAEAPAAPPPTVILPTPWELPPSLPRNAAPAPPARPVFGPPDNRSAAFRDTQRVGTAPNGEPLYAAEWYREPDEVAMRSYLSTSRGPGWGLIACRTAPDYRVEDCVALDEYPEGSQINRSVLAAAWEFRVRPPRRGGTPLVGSWVRIRIDYRFDRH